MTVLKALAALMALLVGAGTFAATRIVRATNLETFKIVRIVTIFVFLGKTICLLRQIFIFYDRHGFNLRLPDLRARSDAGSV